MKDWDIEMKGNGSDIYTIRSAGAEARFGLLTDALADCALDDQEFFLGQCNNHWASTIRVNGRRPEAS